VQSFLSSPQQRILILADAHLPLDNRHGAKQRLRQFQNVIEHYRDNLGLLILLGDIFDFWWEWRTVVPKNATSLLFLVRELRNSGIPVHFFAGNHDFKISGYLECEIGMELHHDDWVAMIDRKKVYFHHGDGFAISDTNYRRMRRIFRNPVAQWGFGTLLHPDLAMNIGRFFSSLGERKRGEKPYPHTPFLEYQDRVREILATGYDMVVIGHTHRPQLIEFEEGIFHNPGPFLDRFCYSIIEGDLPVLKVWE